MRRLKRAFVRLSSSGLVLAALVASGCQEAPSYAVRWRISPRLGEDLPQTPEPQNEEMTNPSVCARSGVSQVEVWVFDETRPGDFIDQVVDVFRRPCFPERFRRSGGAVRGATLSPGDYTMLVVGTRANSAAWGPCAPIDGEGSCEGSSVQTYLQAADAAGLPLCSDGECDAALDTCDCADFTVVADRVVRIPDFSLSAPPDCEDGIDGDEDGLVDALDPGCQLGVSESTPVLNPEIALSLSVLSGNPNAGCKSLGLGSLAISIDDEPLDRILCDVGVSRFSTPLSVGEHQLSVIGLDGSSNEATVEKVMDFVVNDRGVTEPALLEVDFADVDTLEPIDALAQFQLELQLPDDSGAVNCLDDRVGADDFRVRLLDLGREPVFPAPRSEIGRLNGASQPCRPLGGSTLVGALTTIDELRWGGYLLEFEAYNADGELCWSNADNPTPLAPQEAVGVVALPVEGAPDSCFGG